MNRDSQSIMRVAGLVVLVVGLVMWVLVASSLLDGLRGGHTSLLDTVTATATEPAPTAESGAATATSTALATGTAAAGSTATATPTATTVPQQTYTVASGDNLTKIANKFGVTIAALEAANKITDPATLRAGEVIVIPAH